MTVSKKDRPSPRLKSFGRSLDPASLAVVTGAYPGSEDGEVSLVPGGIAGDERDVIRKMKT